MPLHGCMRGSWQRRIGFLDVNVNTLCDRRRYTHACPKLLVEYVFVPWAQVRGGLRLRCSLLARSSARRVSGITGWVQKVLIEGWLGGCSVRVLFPRVELVATLLLAQRKFVSRPDCRTVESFRSGRRRVDHRNRNSIPGLGFVGRIDHYLRTPQETRSGPLVPRPRASGIHSQEPDRRAEPIHNHVRCSSAGSPPLCVAVSGLLPPPLPPPPRPPPLPRTAAFLHPRSSRMRCGLLTIGLG